MDVDPTLELGAFKHVVVPIGVVIALGVARIITAGSQYLHHRERVRFSASHGVWCVILFLWFVGLWWITWGLRGVPAERWSFFGLIFLLIGPCMMYLATTLLLPDLPEQGTLDLEESLMSLARPFFLSLASVLVWLAAAEIWLLEDPWLSLPKRALQSAAVVMLAIAAGFPSRRTSLTIGALLLPCLVFAFATFRARLV